jgi:hypothetical protein
LSRGLARKPDLGYINTDEQIEKSRLAQAPEKGEKTQGKEKVTVEDCEIERSIPSVRYAPVSYNTCAVNLLLAGNAYEASLPAHR